MTKRKTDSEPREEDEELKVEKEKLRDLDVSDEAGADVKGGRPSTVKFLCTVGCE